MTHGDPGDKLDTDSRTDIRLGYSERPPSLPGGVRIRNSPGPRHGKDKLARLIREVQVAFDAIPARITLTP